MGRCQGYTINGHKCRSRIEESGKIYCSESHKPKNIESALEECYFCCLEIDKEKINDEIRVLKCGHAHHRLCINSWLKSHHTCPICRRIFA